jgi:hypothetical protein
MQNEEFPESYTKAFDQMQTQNESALRASMFGASQTTPETHAKSMELSQASGVDPEIVSRNIPEVEQKVAQDSIDYKKLLSENPKVAQYLEDVNNASIHRKEVINLTNFDDVPKKHSKMENLQSRLHNGVITGLELMPSYLPEGLATLGGSAVDLSNLVFDKMGIPGRIEAPEFHPSAELTRYRDSLREQLKFEQEVINPSAWGSGWADIKKGDLIGAGGNFVLDAVESAPLSIALLGAAFSGLGTPALAGIGLTTSGQHYDESADSGASPEARRLAANLNGAFEAGFESLELVMPLKHWGEALVKQVGRDAAGEVVKSFAKSVAYNTGVEATGEGLTQFSQDMADYLTGVDPNAMNGAWERAFNAAAAGAVSGGTINAAGSVGIAASRMERIKQVAENSKKTLTDIGSKFDELKAQEKLPGSTKTFAQTNLKGTTIENMVFKTDVFESLVPNTAEVVQKLGIAKEYELGRETGEVIIPTAVILDNFSGTPEFEKLKDSFRFQEQEKTVEEVEADEKVQADLKQQVAAAVAEAKAVEAANSENPMVAQEQKLLNMIKGTGEIPEFAKPIARSIRNVVENIAGFAKVEPQTILQNLPLIIQNAGEGQAPSPKALFQASELGPKREDLPFEQPIKKQLVPSIVEHVLSSQVIEKALAAIKKYRKPAVATMEGLVDRFGASEIAKAKKSLKPFIEKAQASKPEFDSKIKAIADATNTYVRKTGLKAEIRTIEKHISENDKDPRAMKDLVRGTIVTDSIEDARNVVKVVEKIYGKENVLRVKDRFLKPSLDGYSDILINVKMENGVTGEIQLSVPEFVLSKSVGHELYTRARSLHEVNPIKQELEDLQREIYSEARASSLLRSSASNIISMNSSGVAGEPLPVSPEGNSTLPGRNAQAEPSGNLATGLPSISNKTVPAGNEAKSKSFSTDISVASLLERLTGKPRPVKSIDYVPMGNLLPHETEAETRFGEIAAQPNIVELYSALDGTDGGKVLDVDLARQLMPEYAASANGKTLYTLATQKVARAIITKMYAERLLIRDGNAPVVFLAGGGGSGKGSIPKDGIEGANTVIDGTFADFDKSMALIDQAKYRESVVKYVYLDAKEAARRAALRFLNPKTGGRYVPVDVLLEDHIKAQETILRMAKERPHVRLTIWDNNGKVPRKISVEELNAVRYTKDGESVEQVATRLADEVYKLKEVRDAEGKIRGIQREDVAKRAKLLREKEARRLGQSVGSTDNRGVDGGQQGVLSGKVTLEVAPDPNDLALTERWNALSIKQKTDVSLSVAKEMIPKILASAGVEGNVVEHLGGYLGVTNPSFSIELPEGTEPHKLVQVASIAGFSLSQDSVLVTSPTKFGGSSPTEMITVHLPDGSNSETITKIFGELSKLKKGESNLVEGHTTIDNKMMLLVDPKITTADELGPMIDSALGEQFLISSSDIFSSFVSKGENDYGLQGEGSIGGKSSDAEIANNLRGKASGLIDSALGDIEREGTGGQKVLRQSYRSGDVDRNGQITIEGHLALVELFKSKNLTTILHESGHYFYEVIERLATAPNAAPEIKQLHYDIREWFGVKEGGTPTDEMLERFANAYETYLMEGVAPTENLRSVFAKFKAWFTSVYAGIPKTQMDPKIRDIFDRMTSGKDAATRAREAQSLGPIFKDAASAQMSDVEYQKYKKAVTDASEAADEQITTKFLKKYSREQKKLYAAKRVGVEAGARAEVEAMPIYQTIEKLQHNQTPDTPLKLKTSDIPSASRAGLPKGVTSEANGMHPDVIAGVLGFESGSELMAAISNATEKEQLIDDMTYRRMLIQFPDIAEGEDASNEAIKAHLNDRQAYKLKLESDILFKNSLPVVKAGIRRIARRPAPQASITQASLGAIGEQNVGDIKPNIYKISERRQAKESGVLFTKGDLDGAFVAKERERMNFELFRRAIEAKEYISRAFDLFEKVLGPDSKLAPKREMNYVNAARAVLAEFGLAKKGKTSESYLAPIKEYDVEKYQTILAMVDSAISDSANYNDVPFNKFMEMTEAVTAIWELSKHEKFIEVNGKMIERQEAIDDLTVAMDSIPGGLKENEFAGFATSGEKNKMGLLGLRSRGRRVESWAERMDQKNPRGPFHTYMWNVINDATVKFGVEKVKYLEKFNELAKAVAPGMSYDVILAPELGPNAKFADKGYLLGAILHRGNPSNFSKLLRGYKWGTLDENGVLDTSRWDAFEKRMQKEGMLTKVDYDFAQGVWDLMEELKPESQKAHKKMYGKFYDEVTSEEFDTPFGRYKGGYYPAMADPFVNPDARIRTEKEQLEGQENSFMFPTPAKGFTKNRSEGYARPLILDIRQASSHMDKVLRFIHIAPHTNDVAKILWDKDFRSTLDALDPTAASNMLVPWLQRSVLQITTIPIKGPDGAMLDNFWRQIRKSAGEQIMVGNIVNGAMQITGLSASLIRVKPSHLRDALWKYRSGPKAFVEEITNKSSFMSLELEKQIIDIQNDINEIVFEKSGLDKVRTFSDRHGYFFQRSFQNMVNVITWTGAYDQAIATQSGISEEEAIRQADATVRQTQGGFRPIDISSLEVQKSYIQLFQMFYSYYNQQANTLGTEFATSITDKGFKKGIGRAVFAGMMAFTLPAVMGGMLRQLALGKGLDDDDNDGYMDEVMSWFFASQFDAATSIVPFLGPVLRAGVARFNNKTFDDNISTSPAIAMLERVVHTPGDLYKAYIGTGSKKESMKDVLTLMGYVLRVPLAFAAKPIGYSMDVASGKARPAGPIDFARGLMTGK